MAKGQAVIVPVALIAGWVALRLMLAGGEQPEPIARPALEVQAAATVAVPKVRRPIVLENVWAQADTARLPEIYGRGAVQSFVFPLSQADIWRRSGRAVADLGFVRSRTFVTRQAATKLLQLSVARSNAMTSSGAFVPSQPAQASPTNAGPAKGGQGKKAKRLSVYGYAFWRDGGGSNALAPRAQYGGSQIGVTAAYRLADAPSAPELSARFNIDAEKFDQPEAALGLRWRPLRKLPVALTIERRFREGPTDSVAAFLAGGFDTVRLAEEIQLSGYAQAGFDRRDAGTKKLKHFYDANLKAGRHIARDGALDISAGGGVWAGGQRGVNRVDAGPGVNVDFALANTNWRMSADYRFRVLGDANPGSGLAVTLSASY